jgi:predicted dehydrogenase
MQKVWKTNLFFESRCWAKNNAILDELETFADAITNNTNPIVTLEQATEALKVAYQIIDCFKK